MPFSPGSTPSVPSTVANNLSKDEAALVTLVEMLRAKIRDYPELNVLLAGNESADSDLAMAIVMAISDWNNTPPLLDSISFASHPAPELLLDKAASELLRSVALQHERNRLNVQVSGDTVQGFFDKGPTYMQWAALLEQTYEAKKRNLKMAINLEGGFNGSSVSSEYEIVNRMYNTMGSRSPR